MTPPEPGRYRRLAQLGAGGMGEVFLVFDHVLHREVAEKVLHARLENDVARERFEEEARITAQLEHPGVVPVYDYAPDGTGRPSMHLRRIRGTTLAERIREVHAASTSSAWGTSPTGWTFHRLVDAFRRVCEAVAYAHHRGVVHRDLKPANVMVGEFGEVLVLDWGLAKLVPAAGEPIDPGPKGHARTPRPRVVQGTPAYMSPEQAWGNDEAVGLSSDVYALGAILYEILTGRPPYEGRDPHAVLHQVRSGPPLPPTRSSGHAQSLTFEFTSETVELTATLDQLVPTELVTACTRAMARAPAERHPDASALAADVAAWLEGSRRLDLARAFLTRAQAVEPEMLEARRRAAEVRGEAAAQAAAVPLHAPLELKREVWALEDAAAELERVADVREAEVARLLHAAVEQSPGSSEPRQALADWYRRGCEAAEAVGDRRAAGRLELLVRANDPGGNTDWLTGEGRVSLASDPPGARVIAHRLEPRDRRLAPVRALDLGRTPLAPTRLDRGSWLLELEHPDAEPVRYPVFLGRNQHHAPTTPVRLPPRGSLRPDEVYVPAGPFTSGEPAAGPGTPVPQTLHLAGFVIQRFAVSNADWIGFLDDLLHTGGEAAARAHLPRERGASDGAGVFRLGPHGGFVLAPDEDGDLWDPSWPVILVDWASAGAYAAWRAAREGLPWRLPWEAEWEKAARGVDARVYPWGDTFDPDFANTRESHPGRPLPCPVGLPETDESVYGVRGLGGNVRCWCADRWQPGGVRPPGGVEGTALEARVIRGGSFATSGHRLGRAWARDADAPASRKAHIGVRLVRSWP